MKKISALYNIIDGYIDDLNSRYDQYEEKQSAIEDIASEHDRDMTQGEQDRWDKYEEKKDEINELIDILTTCNDELEYYCED